MQCGSPPQLPFIDVQSVYLGLRQEKQDLAPRDLESRRAQILPCPYIGGPWTSANRGCSDYKRMLCLEVEYANGKSCRLDSKYAVLSVTVCMLCNHIM